MATHLPYCDYRVDAGYYVLRKRQRTQDKYGQSLASYHLVLVLRLKTKQSKKQQHTNTHESIHQPYQMLDTYNNYFLALSHPCHI